MRSNSITMFPGYQKAVAEGDTQISIECDTTCFSAFTQVLDLKFTPPPVFPDMSYLNCYEFQINPTSVT